ncbi:TIR domain-containing protein [Agrobacterium vitis]|uniref:toll/interleukin-1 receptor domain-containing protein n=1 Tax=Agrobacterium vitis TaxID=373 RepID=UPI0012E7DD2E|nr:toll/interleukin-1 receptor domain-containing protein [Agrobacterium vitis]MVA81175.1 TIR domain-containing protein [Agrobacterium vitis]
MADQVPTIDEIDSAEKLGAYLRIRPVEEAQLLALRLAVRVMPVVTQFLSKPFAFQMKSGLIGAIFRCTLISWAAGNFPAHETPGMIASLASAGSAAAFAAAGLSFSASASAFASFAASASASAARATFVLSSDSAIGFASAVASAVASASDEIWLVIRSDLRRMAQLGVPPVLRSGLWEDQQLPGRIGADEKDFRRALLTLGDHWLPVWDFYFAVRNGEAPYAHLKDRQEEVLVGIATENEEFWNRDPDEVMKEVSERLKEKRRDEQEHRVAQPTSNYIDFFISYSTKNETSAREINSYLEDAGYSTIAQFKDFPVGSNFVIEMQDGLERGARAIALLSPDYVASDHCRAEWAAIYNMDPIGKRRKLVSFLLEPTELNKLQRQIVYSSLIGLKQDARRKAVLDAVRHVVEVVTPDQLKQKLADIASPDVAVTADGKIDVTPNAKYDLAVNSPDLPDLPTSLRVLCAVIEASLPENSPKSIAPNLRGYRGHLEERGANPIVGLLGMLVTALTKEFESADFEFWGSGLNENFESFFACHSKFLGHFPRSGEREQTYAEAEIDEDEASGDDLIQPVQSVADAVEELKAIGKVTPGLERVVQEQVQTAKDVSSLPPNLSEDAGKGNVITPKRRFVLSQLGFWERMLAAVGSMTTLATTPQGQAAIAALREAIAKFLSLILL